VARTPAFLDPLCSGNRQTPNRNKNGCQDSNDPCVFTTYERFADQAAMDRHNNSDVVARFFGIAKPILDGDVTLVTSSELFAKR
jgi:quinol monooxygenase YgiN